jgi:hypothetical protein
MQKCSQLGRRAAAGPERAESIGQTKRRLLLRRFDAEHARIANR